MPWPKSQVEIDGHHDDASLAQAAVVGPPTIVLHQRRQKEAAHQRAGVDVAVGVAVGRVQRAER